MSRIFIGLWVLCGILLLGTILLFWLSYPSDVRQTIVIAGNPVSVFTIHPATKGATVISVSHGVFLRGPYAMGSYPVESFWKMGSLNRRDRGLLAKSVSVTFGVPVSGFVGIKRGLGDATSSSVSQLRSIFSIAGIMRYISGQLETDMPLLTYMSFVRYVMSLRDADIRVFDHISRDGVYKEQMPDGSVQEAIDPDKLDLLLKNEFVYESVRKEALTVKVLNTTHVPDLAAMVARQFVNSGVYVVAVDNEDVSVADCTISGSEEILRSNTAKYVQSVYACRMVTPAKAQREDIVVRLGEKNAYLYTPQKRR